MPPTARVPNPYHPGFNQPPVVLAGRDTVLEEFEEALQIAALDGRTPRPLVLLGPRGVGKTVTLGEIALIAAQQRSWPTVHVEATAATFLPSLIDRLRQVEQLISGTVPRPPRPRVTGGKVSASGFGIGAEVQLAKPSGESAQPEQRLGPALEAVGRICAERDTGVVLTLDELQAANPGQVNALAAALQEQVPRGWPLVVVIAALPSLRTTRGARRLPTYLERAAWHDLGPLSEQATKEALTGPAGQSGRPMTAAAAKLLVSVSGGYPYAIQLAGHYAWRASAGEARIREHHAAQAIPRIEADLAQLFRSRWEDASERERDYLVAIAQATANLGSAPGGRAVADLLNQSTREVSYLRERLIRKGTIYAGPDAGLHFITPGMGRWILTEYGT